jgi:REP element-mobilizing transposase RayT
MAGEKNKTMTNWRPDFNPDHLYFVTTSVVLHLHLFRRDLMNRLIVDSLDCMRMRHRFKLYAFVVMPNNEHAILQCGADDPLADVKRDLKKHTADRVLRRYRAEGRQSVRDFLAAAAASDANQNYKVWEDGYNARDVFSAEFLRQKISYVHNNPCQPRWDLVERPEGYVWSSARFYLLEEPTVIPVDNGAYLLV